MLAEKTLEIDFFRACKKSRLDARAKVGLVGKCRGPNPGVDADARQLEYRADVPHWHGKSCGFLSFTERKDADQRGHGGPIGRLDDGLRTSWSLWVSESNCRASETRHGRQPQAGCTDYARGQLVGDRTAGIHS